MPESPTLSTQLYTPDEDDSYSISCRDCGFPTSEKAYRSICSECGGALEFAYPEASYTGTETDRSIWKYRRRLPIRDTSKIVSLGEGNTPLIRALSEHDVQLFLKNETVNPTGSHKDRALSIAITKAVEFGFDMCMLYSDGSAALSSAAYAARAGITNIALVPRGSPDYRLLPLMIYNSIVLEYLGPAAEALDWVHTSCRTLNIYETTTYRRANPYQSEGPKTIAYEVVEQLGGVPDWCLVPVGGGGTLAGIWRGFCDLQASGETTRLPRLVGVLPQSYTLLQDGLLQMVTTDQALRDLVKSDSREESAPETAQAKLAMAFPPDGIEAITAIRESLGLFVNVSDEDALASQRSLGSTEGIYVEISAAVSVAALKGLRENGAIQPGETVVALLCGSGFRETGELARTLPVRKLQVDQRSGIEKLARLLEDL